MIDIELETQKDEFKRKMRQLGSFKNRFWSTTWRALGHIIGTIIVGIAIVIIILLIRQVI